jgi:hypothetical protein
MTGTARASVVPVQREREGAVPSPGGPLDCPRCGYHNEAARIRCERCGHELRNARPLAASLPPPEPVIVGRPRSRTWLTVIAAALVVTAAITLVAVALSRRHDDTTTTPGAASPAALRPVDPATVTARASSTIRDSKFRIQNTLDGDPQTVWNSDGKRLRSNVGVTLTYAFAAPVKLARITIVNGSARSLENYTKNQRVATFRVRTDAGETTWQLKDTVEAQSLTLEPAPAKSVTLEVAKVYRGTEWPDLAVTDVSFEQAP